MKLTGIVIRKDGTVPFDAGCHSDVVDAALEWLKAHHPDHEVHRDTRGAITHAKIKNWTPPSS